jgi:hypothetical protein
MRRCCLITSLITITVIAIFLLQLTPVEFAWGSVTPETESPHL